jgi:hypothetical protein
MLGDWEIQFFRPCYKAHTSPSNKLRDYIGTMHLAMHLSFRISMKTFLTLAPRAYVTYHQARGLSGHTSPCGEYACFSVTGDFLRSKVGTLQQERNLFSQEHHAFFEQPASSMLMLVNWFSRFVEIPL